MRVLAIVAHPDDESLFAGGTLAQHAARGDELHVIALSDGVTSRLGWTHAEVEARRAQFQRATAILGATRAEIVYAFDDQRADGVDQLDINRRVEAAIENELADLVYTHHVGDLNLDHRRVAEAVLVATRQGPAVRCMTPEYPNRCVGPAWRPTVRIDISGTMDTKIAACLCYDAELRLPPHPRSERMIRAETHEAFREIFWVAQ